MGVYAAIAQTGIGIAQVRSAREASTAMRKQALWDASIARKNAELIDQQIKDLEEETKENIFLREQQVNQMIGAQRASLAGQGVVVDGELGQAFAKQEREVGRADVRAIKNNAWRRAMGLEIQKNDMLQSSKNIVEKARIQGRDIANRSFFQGASNVASGAAGISDSIGSLNFKYSGGGGSSTRTPTSTVAYNYNPSSTTGRTA